MKRLATRTALMGLPVIAACAGMGDARYPQTADEFLTTYSWGGLFQNKETVAVDRTSAAVTADVREYAKKCLDIKVNQNRASRYALDKYGSGTGGGAIPYNAKVGPLKSGATALSVQEVYDKPPAGVPADGMYTLVAEIQSVGKTKTQVNIYHLKKPFLADPLKKWIEGDKGKCPAL